LFCTYASQRGSYLIDRELYLPKFWVTDPGLRRSARIPEELPYRAVAELAGALVARAIAARVPARWVAANGSVIDPRLRQFFEKSRMWFVIGVATGEPLPMGDRRDRHSPETVAGLLAPDAWFAQSAPQARPWSAHEWARLRMPTGRGDPVRWLLLRRDPGTGENLHSYLCQAGPAVTLPELVDVALLLERNRYVLAAACTGAGLDEYEVRRWTGWYRYTTLALAAHNCLELAGARAEPPDQVSIPSARTPQRRPVPQAPPVPPVPSQRVRLRDEPPPSAARIATYPPTDKEEPCQNPRSSPVPNPLPSPVPNMPPNPLVGRQSRPNVRCASRYDTTSSCARATAPPRRVSSPWSAFRNGRRPGSGH
jgi:hypothetical protein